jgi:ATP-binding cassette, subfamily B, multidrug efflux pump
VEKMKRKSTKPEGPRANMSGLKRTIGYVRHYPRLMLAAYGSVLIGTLAQLAVPNLVRNLIDAVTNGVIAKEVLAAPAQVQPIIERQLGLTRSQLESNYTNAEANLLTAGFVIVGFAIIRGIFSFLQTYQAEKISQSIAYDLRNDLFAKIQQLSFSYHDRQQTGQLMIRATDDVEKVRLFLGQGLVMSIAALILLGGTLILLFATNFVLSLVILPILPITLTLFLLFGKITQPMFMQVQIKLSALNTILQENLAGIKVVKSFAREAEEQTKFNNSADVLMAQQLKVARIFTFLFPTMFLIANLGQGAILYAGGWQIIDTTLTLGEWQAFSLYLGFLFLPLAQIGMIITQMSQAAASSNRIFEILDAKSDITDKPDAKPLPPISGKVEFKAVTFSYPGSERPVLNKMSFVALPGQTVALLGATGSGKTTIINLLPRFYDPTDGQILIDGHNLRDVTIESLRTQIGIVLQETNLFSGTIRDNIAFGRPEARQTEVIEAAKAAAAHDFIIEFPQGYDTLVGERGSTLSGGQKQRIAIARALLLNPRILILDDSTSSVDLVTEYKIQKALDHLMEGRTSFVIAQRISTVVNADQILVLDKGVVVAQGKHAELMETSEIYAEIYQSQLVEDAKLQAETSGEFVEQEV